MRLLVSIEHLPAFSTEEGLASLGLLMELVGRAYQLTSHGQTELAHSMVKDFSEKVCVLFPDNPAEQVILEKAFQDFALILSKTPSDIRH